MCTSNDIHAGRETSSTAHCTHCAVGLQSADRHPAECRMEGSKKSLLAPSGIRKVPRLLSCETHSPVNSYPIQACSPYFQPAQLHSTHTTTFKKKKKGKEGRAGMSEQGAREKPASNEHPSQAKVASAICACLISRMLFPQKTLPSTLSSHLQGPGRQPGRPEGTSLIAVSRHEVTSFTFEAT